MIVKNGIDIKGHASLHLHLNNRCLKFEGLDAIATEISLFKTFFYKKCFSFLLDVISVNSECISLCIILLDSLSYLHFNCILDVYRRLKVKLDSSNVYRPTQTRAETPCLSLYIVLYANTSVTIRVLGLLLAELLASSKSVIIF